MASLLNIGASALSAAQASLSTVSHNIANANTAGYSRQEAVLETAGGQFSGSGFFGLGVQVDTVRRIYDEFLTRSVATSAATSAADGARADGLKSLDALFADPDNGLGAATDALFAAAGDLAARPQDSSARQAFLTRAAQLSQLVTRLGGQVAEQQRDADTRLAGAVSQVNARVTDIQRLNEQIAQAQATGHAPNDLLDQRDAALQALNGLMAVSAVPQDDGTISLFTSSGQPLLVGNSASTLQAIADPQDGSRTALQLSIGGQAQPLDLHALGGGSIAGLATLRDDDLGSVLAQIGRFAQCVGAAFNAQQALGVDMNGNAGAALFSVAAPATTADSRNTGTGTVAAAIVDASALQASDYEVAWDGTNYTVTRLQDRQATTSPTLPLALDGLSITGSGTPQAGDRWLVRPCEPAAVGMAAVPLSPRQLATGQAATIAPAPGNAGGAVASSFAVVRASSDNTLPVDITFNNPPTTFNVTGLASGNLANVPYTPGQALPPAPADWNGWRLALDGTPAAGDSFQVRPNTAPGADNRNALAFASLTHAAIVGGATPNDAYASLLGEVGLRVQSARDAAQVSQALHAQAVSRQQEVSGVNLDEEAADLLRFQQAYQASAKIIQASQSLFESLLAATGR